jgi:hypothetical protein
MRAVGYDPKRSSDSAATFGDLKAMLSTLGVEATTRKPEDKLTARQVAETLTALRAKMPRFTVPVSDLAKTGPGPEDASPGPCQIALQACKASCSEQSPSGTSGGNPDCIHACNDAYESCRRNLFSLRPGSHN